MRTKQEKSWSTKKQKQPEVREFCLATIVIVAMLHSWWRKFLQVCG